MNLLLRGIEGNVVLLFQTGCGMVVTTAYPKTSFRVPYVHNLFQNGAATLAGLVEMCRQRQKRGELPEGEITFVMVSGDGGMDIGMGSAIGTALRNNHLILFEYDNGGYMNTGYQLSYSTPMGAKSSTSHVGPNQYGKNFFHKDTPMIMAATNIPYVATVAECNPADFLKKAAKAKAYAAEHGMAYLKALSACPLNWGDKPNTERRVIQAGVDCCYFPLYEVERGITKITYDPEAAGKKLPRRRLAGDDGAHQTPHERAVRRRRAGHPERDRPPLAAPQGAQRLRTALVSTNRTKGGGFPAALFVQFCHAAFRARPRRLNSREIPQICHI